MTQLTIKEEAERIKLPDSKKDKRQSKLIDTTDYLTL
jgi:hypothetical protein